jgi:hypothetical protein
MSDGSLTLRGHVLASAFGLLACGSQAPPIDEPSCPDGLALCGDACVDPARSDDHCGGCDAPCGADTGCFAGACTHPSPLRNAREGHQAVAGPDGRINVVGGIDGAAPVAEVEAYDPRTNRWSEVGTMLTPRYYLSVVVRDGLIWSIGGVDAPNGSVLAEIFDPVTSGWSVGAPLSIPRGDAATTVSHDGRILMISGNSEELGVPNMDTMEGMSWA